MLKRLERFCETRAWLPCIVSIERTRSPCTNTTVSGDGVPSSIDPCSLEPGSLDLCSLGPGSLDPCSLEPGSLKLRLRRDSAGEQSHGVLGSEAPVAIMSGEYTVA